MLSPLTKIRGPKVEDAERVSFDLSGTQVSFLAPAYNYHMVAQDTSEESKRIVDLGDCSIYWSATAKREEDNLFDPSREVDSIVLFNSIWAFSKPVIDLTKAEPRTKNEGTLQLYLGVKKFFDFQSLFVPCNQELATMFYIDAYFGPTSDLGGPGKGGRRFNGPAIWSVRTFGGISWIGYFVERIGHPNCGDYYWFAPLTREHFVSFCFRITGAPSAKLFAHYEVFMKQMVASCTIKYSEEVQAQINAVAEEAAKSSISTEVKPFAWEEYDRYPEKFEFQMSD